MEYIIIPKTFKAFKDMEAKSLSIAKIKMSQQCKIKGKVTINTGRLLHGRVALVCWYEVSLPMCCLSQTYHKSRDDFSL